MVGRLLGSLGVEGEGASVTIGVAIGPWFEWPKVAGDLIFLLEGANLERGRSAAQSGKR